ncbi:RHS repeat-associated core domain-containing protein [Psychrobacter urativorans]|uniref:RHS repeat-associated core domain-containing protein n=1 Tax=Psychrobacter urativorans TaxID=45610 RepID=UPI00191821EF|nr:RHS repeat-associated core domain-containing protein [Psychrobacter urativorans]
MSDNNKSTALASANLPVIVKPESGATAVGVSSFIANNKGTLLDSGMSVASAIPNDKFSQALGAVNAISRAASAAQQGSALGVGMALAGAVPGSNFSESMGKIGAVTNALSAAKSGSMLGTGMALAGVAPDSPFAKVMGQVAQAKDMLNQGMAILKPNINPSDIMMSFNDRQPLKSQPATTQSGQVSLSGKGGAVIKGEGLRVKVCPFANPEANMGQPVQALYGSKILDGDDDTDYVGQGYLLFTMSRIYSSQNPDTGWFGQGWTTKGYEQRIELDPQHNRIYFVDNTGRKVPFTYLNPGQSCYQPYENVTLYRLPLTKAKEHTKADSQAIAVDATNGTRIGQAEPLEFILYSGDYQPNNVRPDHFHGTSQYYSYVASRNNRGTKAIVLLSSYTDKYGHKIQLHYTRSINQNSAYLPQYLTDAAGGCYEFEFANFNENYRLAKLYEIGDSLKRVVLVEYSYSAEGDLVKVSRRGEITRKFAYQNHLMVGQTQSNGQQVAYRYDRYDSPKAARVIEQTVSNGRHYLFEYTRDSNGLGMTTVTEQSCSEFERQRHYTYDKWYNMLSQTDSNGNSTRFRYDELNRVSKVISPNNAHTNFRYKGKVLGSIELQVGTDPITQLPQYRETYQEYDKAGLLLATMDTIGNKQQFKYDERGELSNSIDPLGQITDYTYDKHGNLSQLDFPNGSQVKFDYDDYGNLASKTDCSGYQTHYEYDNKQRLRQITNADGSQVRYHYDNKAPRLESLVSQIHYPDGSRIQLQYDNIGRLSTYSDTLGNKSTYRYEDDGLPSKRTDAQGNSLTYTYDALRRLTTLTNENGEEWLFSYDKEHNLIAETRFDGHQSHYRYDAIDQLITQIDNPQLPRDRQRHTHLQRSLIGQLIAKHSSHYPEQIDNQKANKLTRPQYYRAHYQYDLIGQLICATTRDSRIEFSYNANSRVIQETLTSHLTHDGKYHVREQNLQYKYDEINNRTAMILPDGKVINQLYYGTEHLYNQSLYDPSSDEHIELRHSEHNKLHQEISRQQGVLNSVYDYDPMGRLVKQHSSSDNHISVERHYNYDSQGQLTHLTGQTIIDNLLNSAQSLSPYYKRGHQYQYDTIGRLTEHKLTDYQNQSGITEVFAFDPASNRIPVKAAVVNTEEALQRNIPQSVQSRPRELIQNNQRIRYTYDSHDRVLYKTIEPYNSKSKNQQDRQALQLQYNANSELEKSLRTQYQGNRVIKTETSYHYDAFGRRTHKHSETRHLTQRQEQLKQTNKTQHQHVHMLWDSNLPIQEYTNTHVYTTIYDQGSFEPVARLAWLRNEIPQVANDELEVVQDNPHLKNYAKPISKIQVYYYHNDQLGTPNELTNQQGEVVWLADYEAWGNTAKIIYNEIKISQIAVSQDHLQPIRFQGQYFDGETGLHYNRFRYYDPDMGMFTTRDPIELNGGMNVFAYAPNPTGWLDPLGLSGWDQVTGSQFGVASADIHRPIRPKITSKCSTVNGKPYLSMSTLDFSAAVIVGLSVGGGYGFSCDENGKKLKCVSGTGCLSAGSGGGAVTAGQAYTNDKAKKGGTGSYAGCVGATAVAVVGGGAQGCKNSDGSTTYAVNISAGAKLGSQASGCGTYIRCW